MQNFKGAIFDMDGTLLDSMPVWKRLTQRYLAQFDVHITDADYAVCEGFSQPQVAEYFLKRYPNLPLTQQQMLDGMDEVVEAAELPVVGESRACPIDASVRMGGVRFSYMKEKPILRGVDLDVPEGSMVAIVGPSGCGKTTLLKLIARFYDVDDGAVRIGGVDAAI